MSYASLHLTEDLQQITGSHQQKFPMTLTERLKLALFKGQNPPQQTYLVHWPFQIHQKESEDAPDIPHYA
jgi:hypothetical protein